MKLNCLIVCYSYTGNTHRLAATLGKLTGGEMLDIWPRQPYPMSDEPLLAQVRQEIAVHYYPKLLPIALDPSDYDVVFVGCPNWCGSIAPPLAAFLVKYKLSGKIIAPFCSHGGGGAGKLRKDIQSLCPGAEVKDILPVMGDGGRDIEETLSVWLREIGLT